MKQAKRGLNVEGHSPKVLKLIECLMGFDPTKRPSVKMSIEIIEMLISE